MAVAKMTQGAATVRTPLKWREHSGSRFQSPEIVVYSLVPLD
jgi:hypothetical protein